MSRRRGKPPFIFIQQSDVVSPFTTNTSDNNIIDLWKEIDCINLIQNEFIYLASTDGRIKRYSKTVPYRVEEIPLLFDEYYFYYYFWVTSASGSVMQFNVHEVIAETFLFKPTIKHQWVGFRDRDKTNNNARNVKWVKPFKKRTDDEDEEDENE